MGGALSNHTVNSNSKVMLADIRHADNPVSVSIERKMNSINSSPKRVLRDTHINRLMCVL